MRSFKKRSKKIGFISFIDFIGIIITTLIIAGALSACGSDKIKDNIIIEAGTSVPDIEEFFINPKTKGNFITDVSVIDTKKTGSTEIEMKIGGKNFMSVLTIEDTIPPSGNPVELYIFAGNEITADDLVTDIFDATNVICSFASQPDVNQPDWQDVTVILTDAGNNKTEIISRLYVFAVIDKLVFEAGEEINVAAKDFIDNYIELEDLSFTSHIEDIADMTTAPGWFFYVNLELKNYSAQSMVQIIDTIQPTGEPVEQYVFIGNDIRDGGVVSYNLPEMTDLVTNIEDKTEVSLSWGSPREVPHSGWNNTSVMLTDESGNSARIETRFYAFDVISELIIEAGTSKELSAKDFIRNYIKTDGLSLTQNDSVNFSVPGSYNVTLISGKYEFPAVVKIADTTPPTAYAQNRRVYKNKPVPAVDFVYNITDFSAVSVKYKSQPDFSAVGVQTVYLILEDSYGNISEYTAKLTIIEDNMPPKISGELNKTVIAGGTISYRTGVTVTDDCDPNAELVVDSSQVNLNKPGTYTVIYSATDENGNKAEVKGTVTVTAIDMALVNDMADGILSKIITKDMSQYNKAKAIYNWVNAKMTYSASLAPRETAQAAYNCFTRGAGDCYTYMAASRVLLTRAGIQNKTVQRIPEAKSQHYWNLVNTGDGWYHFDVCPTPGDAVTSNQRFMFTESQAKKYTKTIKDKEHYYDYDKSTVPEAVE